MTLKGQSAALRSANRHRKWHNAGHLPTGAENMNRKTWIAGLLAAVVMFIWGFIAHDVLPFGQMALKTTATEDAVMAGVKTNVSASGMYVIPGQDMIEAKKLSGDQQKAAMKAYMDKWSG